MKLFALAIAAACVLARPVDAAQEELETVVVTGEVPGPGLWKVSKGDHVMWVLANHQPLPKGLSLRTQQIDARIAESQEVLYPPYVNIQPNIGMIRGFSLGSAGDRAAKLPDGTTLKDVLPPDVHARWLVLREKYLGEGDYVETRRPATAMRLLNTYATRKHGLQGGPNVRQLVDGARKKHKVKPVWLPTVRRTVELKDPKGLLESLQDLQQPEVDCFIRDLDRLESDIDRQIEMANAWSHGDTEKLRHLFRPQTLKDAVADGCLKFSLAGATMSAMPGPDTADSSQVKKLLESALWHEEQAALQAQLDWLKAAQAALEKNKSTFTVLPLADVFRADGHLEKLRELGYMVEEPG